MMARAKESKKSCFSVHMCNISVYLRAKTFVTQIRTIIALHVSHRTKSQTGNLVLVCAFVRLLVHLVCVFSVLVRSTSGVD